MHRRIPLSIEVRAVLKRLMYTLLGLLMLLSAYFFVKMIRTAEKGYSLRENQILQQVLEAENRLLKQRVLEAQSLSELQKSGVVKKMTLPENPVFVKPNGPLSRGH